MQQVLGYSAFRTGVAYVATTVTLVVVAIAAQALVTRIGPRVVLVTGLLFVSASIFLYSRLPVTGSYVSDLLPAFLLVGHRAGADVRADPDLVAHRRQARRGGRRLRHDQHEPADRRRRRSCRDHHDRDDDHDELHRESRALGGDRGHRPRERLSGRLLRAPRRHADRRGADRDPAQRHEGRGRRSGRGTRGRDGWAGPMPWETAAREQRHRTKRSGRLPDSATSLAYNVPPSPGRSPRE